MSITKGQIFYQLGLSNQLFTELCIFIKNLQTNILDAKTKFEQYFDGDCEFQSYSEQCEIISNILTDFLSCLEIYLLSSSFEEEESNRNTLSQNFSLNFPNIVNMINLLFQNCLTNRYFTTFNTDGTVENNLNFYSSDESTFIYLYQVSSVVQKNIFLNLMKNIKQTFVLFFNQLNSLKKWNNQLTTTINNLIQITIKENLINSISELITITNSISCSLEYIGGLSSLTSTQLSSDIYTDLAVFEESYLISGFLLTFSTNANTFISVTESIFSQLLL
jgi:hypothetical protein